MPTSAPPICIKYPIFLWSRGSPIRREYGRLKDTDSDGKDKLCLNQRIADKIQESDVSIILAHADIARKDGHRMCRDALSEQFQIPRIWWSDYSRKSNGYLGCETHTDDDGNITGMTSWVRFIVKIFDHKIPNKEYIWYKINMFVNWEASSGKTAVLVFEPPGDLQEKLPGMILDNLQPKTLMDPFWIYPFILEDIVEIQNRSVWSIRTMVRDTEKARGSASMPDEKPKPDYARLHDIARHAIHGIETLNLAVKTAQIMIKSHASFRETSDALPTPGKKAVARAAYQNVHERLFFFEHLLDSLRHRSESNKQRLLNEIQLAFNRVSQFDSGVSLQISNATLADSTAMRTIAVMTMAFLPATFTAALFDMSFFSYDPQMGFSVAKEFWWFWIIAVPLTVATAMLWSWWQKFQSARARKKLALDIQGV